MSTPRYRRPGKSAPPSAAPSPKSPHPDAAASALSDAAPVRRSTPLDRAAALLAHVQRHSTAISAVYLGVLLAICLKYMLVSLSRSWFFSSDEYDFAGEAIRFLNLDLHQHFFDMPGTPFMMLSAVLWAIFYPLHSWLSPDTSITGITDFTYQHLDWLFTLLRSCTILFYAASVALLFPLARRLSNRVGAFMACLLLAMSPMYAKYSSFCRVESMAVCLALSALLVFYRALERNPSRLGARPSWRDPMILSGILVGMAAAARLHSLAATLPLLFLIPVFDERMPRRQAYPRWTLSAAMYLLPSMFVAGALCYWWARSRVSAEFPTPRRY
jgi:uncharacterized membrane protein